MLDTEGVFFLDFCRRTMKKIRILRSSSLRVFQFNNYLSINTRSVTSCSLTLKCTKYKPATQSLQLNVND
jgi:hypothetical protein